MLIGAVPGSIDADPGKAAYQRLVRGQFSLGHRSAQRLGETMMRVGKIKGHQPASGYNSPPHQEEYSGRPSSGTQAPRSSRNQSCQVSRLDKLGAKSYNPTWKQAGDACERRHLSVVDPSMVVLLGKEVADYLSKSESWGMEGVKISEWAEQTDYRQLQQ